MTPKTLGQTAYRLVLGCFFAGVVLWVVFVFASGRYSRWKAERAEDRARVAEYNAKVAASNSASANAGAANATMTRGRTDELVIDVRGLSEVGARRIEATVPKTPADDTLDSDVLAELDAAEKRVTTQARRLRRSK